MHHQLVLALGIHHFDLLLAVDQPTLIADLSTTFRIKGCTVQYDLVLIAAFVPRPCGSAGCAAALLNSSYPTKVVSPVPSSVQSPVVTAVAARERSFCFLKFPLELPSMSTPARFSLSHQLGEVDGEAEGVKELKCKLSGTVRVLRIQHSAPLVLSHHSRECSNRLECLVPSVRKKAFSSSCITLSINALLLLQFRELVAHLLRRAWAPTCT
jgi:hypothetical protein